MLSTYLASYPWLAPALLVSVAVVGPLLGWWLATRRRAAWASAALALAVTLAATLLPTERSVELGCVLDLDVRLLAPEPLANVVLLVPFALLVGVATRKPLLGALTGVSLSVAIELMQALVPTIGRSCTAGDVVANAAGAGLGALLALAALGLARTRAQRAASAAELGAADPSTPARAVR